MTTWLITETCEYTVEADTREEAEELFGDHGPAIDGDGPVAFIGVTDRTYEVSQ